MTQAATTIRFQILRTGPTTFRWRALAPSGEQLCCSEIYAGKAACMQAVGLLKQGAARARVSDLTESERRVSHEVPNPKGGATWRSRN